MRCRVSSHVTAREILTTLNAAAYALPISSSFKVICLLSFILHPIHCGTLLQVVKEVRWKIKTFTRERSSSGFPTSQIGWLRDRIRGLVEDPPLLMRNNRRSLPLIGADSGS